MYKLNIISLKNKYEIQNGNVAKASFSTFYTCPDSIFYLQN